MSVCTWFNYIPRIQGVLTQIEYNRGYPTAFKPAVHPSGDGERDPKGCLDIVDNQPLHKIRDGSMCMVVGGSLAPMHHLQQVISIRMQIFLSSFAGVKCLLHPNFMGFLLRCNMNLGFFPYETRPCHDISTVVPEKRWTQRVDSIHQGGVKGPRFNRFDGLRTWRLRVEVGCLRPISDWAELFDDITVMMHHV